MSFPVNPTNGQRHGKYKYIDSLNAWNYSPTSIPQEDNLILFAPLYGNNPLVNRVGNLASVINEGGQVNSDYTVLNNSPDTNQGLLIDLNQNLGNVWTISMSVRLTASSDEYWHLFTAESGQSTFGLKATRVGGPTPLKPYIFGSGWDSISADTALRENIWQNIIASSNGSSVSLYIGGYKVAEDNISVNIPESRFHIGRGYSSRWEYCEIRVANIRVWNSALINSERHMIAHSGFSEILM